MKKIKWKNVFVLLIILFFLTMLIYSIINIIKWKINIDKINDQIEIIDKKDVVEEVTNNDDSTIVNKQEIGAGNPYWDYIDMPFIRANFEELNMLNSDTVGFIKVNGTNINYPIVQSNDNDFYLHHSFDKKYNECGWVFMDYRNKSFMDSNTILYGHSLKNSTMFGSLKNILNNNWYSNTDNHIIKISTEKENTLWQVFSIYEIPVTSDYLETNFNTKEDYRKFLNKLYNRSKFKFDTAINTNDKIITLSTCNNKVNRIVMHAKLIKKELREES